MSFFRQKSAPFGRAYSGLTGTVGYTLINPGATPGAALSTGVRITGGIVELPAGSGIYWAFASSPDAGCGIVWDTGGATAIYAADEIKPDPFFAHGGTAQAAAANAIILQASDASATDQLYRGHKVKIEWGTGVGQSRIITDYKGTTHIATVDRAWAAVPDSTSVYSIFALATPKLTDALESTPVPVDGLLFTSWGRALLAIIGGVTTVNGSMVSFMGTDGVTVAASETYGSINGQRIGRTITP